LWRYRRNRDQHKKGSVRWKFWNRLAVREKRLIDRRTEQIAKANPVKKPSQVKLDSRWGGCQAVFEQIVHPYMKQAGLPITSLKRSYDTVAGSLMSDHYMGCSKCYAADYGTYSGADEAKGVAKALGISGYRTGTYTRYPVTIGGQKFSAQILWAVQGHLDHVHVGLRRA